MWNLLLRIGSKKIDVILYSVVEDNSLIYRSFPIDDTAPTRIAAIENIIYDNPALLNEFRRVWCVVETNEYCIVPAECGENSELLFRRAFPESKSDCLRDISGTNNALILYGVEPELRRFMNRTYLRLTFTSHLAVLCRYFSMRASQGNSAKMVANLREKSLDLIVTDGRALLLANTFTFNTVDDAAYYILACRERLGLNPLNDEIFLSGSPSVKEDLIPILRKYISRVLPVIFPPQMFKAGKDSMRAPFDLAVAALCE